MTFNLSNREKSCTAQPSSPAEARTLCPCKELSPPREAQALFVLPRHAMCDEDPAESCWWYALVFRNRDEFENRQRILCDHLRVGLMLVNRLSAAPAKDSGVGFIKPSCNLSVA